MCMYCFIYNVLGLIVVYVCICFVDRGRNLFPEHVVRNISYQIIQAVSYMHSHGKRYMYMYMYMFYEMVGHD